MKLTPPQLLICFEICFEICNIFFKMSMAEVAKAGDFFRHGIAFQE